RPVGGPEGGAPGRLPQLRGRRRLRVRGRRCLPPPSWPSSPTEMAGIRTSCWTDRRPGSTLEVEAGSQARQPEVPPMTTNLDLPVAFGPRWVQQTWMVDAACAGCIELFFPPAGEREGARLRREDKAGAVCATCPVLEQCR